MCITFKSNRSLINWKYVVNRFKFQETCKKKNEEEAGAGTAGGAEESN